MSGDGEKVLIALWLLSFVVKRSVSEVGGQNAVEADVTGYLTLTLTIYWIHRSSVVRESEVLTLMVQFETALFDTRGSLFDSSHITQETSRQVFLTPLTEQIIIKR
jgi:hypothetical protein